MECLRIDESGYIGFERSKPERRLQGAAAIAIAIDDGEAWYMAIRKMDAAVVQCW